MGLAVWAVVWLGRRDLGRGNWVGCELGFDDRVVWVSGNQGIWTRDKPNTMDPNEK